MRGTAAAAEVRSGTVNVKIENLLICINYSDWRLKLEPVKLKGIIIVFVVQINPPMCRCDQNLVVLMFIYQIYCVVELSIIFTFALY